MEFTKWEKDLLAGLPSLDAEIDNAINVLLSRRFISRFGINYDRRNLREAVRRVRDNYGPGTEAYAAADLVFDSTHGIDRLFDELYS